MKNLETDIIYAPFISKISAFSPNNLRDKNKNGILAEGINVFEAVPGFTSSILFFYDPLNFDFHFATSNTLSFEGSNKIYESLLKAGAITKALSSFEIAIHQSDTITETEKYFIIVPLLIDSGITGLIILGFKEELEETDLFLKLVSIHANHFAGYLNQLDLNKELETIKDNFEKRIAIRTKDIAQSTREIKSILDTVQVGIIIVNKSTDVIEDANLLAVKTIGKPKEDIIGSKRSDYFLFSKIKLAPGEIRNDDAAMLLKSNGEIISVIHTISEIVIGEESFYLENFIDISDRKKMEETILKSQNELEKRVEERTAELNKINIDLKKKITERIKAEEEKSKLYWAVHQSPISITITDLKGNIEYVNPRFLKITGYSYAEVVGKNPRLLKSGDLSLEAYKNLWKTIKSNKEWHAEFRNKRKNGDLYWVSTLISPVRNSKGEIINYIAVQEEITERKRIAQELLNAKEIAEESNRLKTALLANMSHEFRTPLISILGFSEYLISEEKEDDHLEMLNDIHSSGKRLLGTLDGVLQLSQIEILKSSLRMIRTNLSGLLRLVRLNFIEMAKSKGIELNIDIKLNDISAAVDVDLFKKSVNNLVDNAIKYTETGSVNVSLDLVYSDTNKWAVIKVKDTGVGIDPKDTKVIFEAFRQVSEGHIRNYEGCGLGLTLTQKLIEIMGGHITLESTVGIGSTFYIWMPAL